MQEPMPRGSRVAADRLLPSTGGAFYLFPVCRGSRLGRNPVSLRGPHGERGEETLVDLVDRLAQA